MSAYRAAMVLAADETPDPLALPRYDTGPQTACVGCNVAKETDDLGRRRDVVESTACQAHRRVMLRWFPWPRRCRETGPHIHQSCSRCKFKWIVNPGGV